MKSPKGLNTNKNVNNIDENPEGVKSKKRDHPQPSIYSVSSRTDKARLV